MRASSSVRELWKNGLGTTLVIASDTREGDRESWSSWTWRLSIADVPTRGAFSIFSGIDRWIAHLDGEGLTLERDGALERVPSSGRALAFAGEASVVGVPEGDGVRDVNLMLRRGACAGELHLVRDGRASWSAPLVVVHAAGGAVAVEAPSDPSAARLESGETLVTEGEVSVTPLDGSCAVVCVIHSAD